MSTMWDDNERSAVFRSYHHRQQVKGIYEPLGPIIKDIAFELDSQKQSILWNEVEHVNYMYELIYTDDGDSSNEEEDEDIVEVVVANDTCMDKLTKNLTAYT